MGDSWNSQQNIRILADLAVFFFDFRGEKECQTLGFSIDFRTRSMYFSFQRMIVQRFGGRAKLRGPGSSMKYPFAYLSVLTVPIPDSVKSLLASSIAVTCFVLPVVVVLNPMPH